MTPDLKLHWWRDEPNFGDAISPLIVAAVSGRTVVLAARNEAELFAIGSIMRAVRLGWSRGGASRPWVWGTGMTRPLRRDFVRHVNFAALRGPASLSALGLDPDLPVGDPGLLISDLVAPLGQRGDAIGIVPHYSKLGTEAYLRLQDEVPGAVLIDVRAADPLDVVRQIGACRHVFASSLQGLIVADALGVPNTWLDPAGNHSAADFKFHDYFRAIGRESEAPALPESVAVMVDELRDLPMPYAGNIARIQERLRDAFPAELRAGYLPPDVVRPASVHPDTAMITLPEGAPLAGQLAGRAAGKPLLLPPLAQAHVRISGRDLVFHLNMQDDPIQNCHRAGRFYEAEELALLVPLLPAAPVVLDIGANIGNHSLYFAAIAGAVRVIPVEPNPLAIAPLLANVLGNRLEGQISLEHLGFGLSDRTEGGFSMKAHDRNLGATKMFAGTGGPLEVRRGDDEFPDLMPDLVKIDVEGMEIEVLRGLEALVARSKPVLMVEVGLDRSEEFAEWALERGYLIHSVRPVAKSNDNYILLPPEHPAAQEREEENA